MSSQHTDVLIVGAGLSGIGAACHLAADLPGTSYEIVEARGSSGGTWDLFRFPGVRSDSDMFTLGFPFRPWLAGQAIADGADILSYVRETAAEYGVDAKISYHQQGHVGRLVGCADALDRGDAGHQDRRPGRAHLRISVPVLGLLQL